jgi:hypothetical protein
MRGKACRFSSEVFIIVHRFNKTKIYPQIFIKHVNNKFHKYPFSGSRVISCEQRERDMAKLLGKLFGTWMAPTTSWDKLTALVESGVR